MRGIVAIVVVTAASVAGASPRPTGEAGQDFDRELANLDKALAHPAPGAGLDRARVGRPRWCAAVGKADVAWPDNIAQELDTYRKSTTQQNELFRVAADVCTLPDEPAYQRVAAEVLQYWIDETGLAETDAVGSLAARLDHDAWVAEHDQLCKAFGFGDGHDDEASAIVDARRQLFGCDDEDADHAAWMDVHALRLDKLAQFLDGGAVDRDRDELVRMAYVGEEIAYMFDTQQAGAEALVAYAVVQLDIHALDYDAARKQLDAAPYRDNRFARIVVGESLAHARLQVARVEAAVAQRSADGKWKQLLVTAPQTAVAAYRAALAKHADALARSEQIGTTADCATKLRADLAPILRALPHANRTELTNAISDDAAAGVLVRRYASCLDAVADPKVARVWKEFATGVDAIAGPRGAAYAATLRALDPRRDDDILRALSYSDPHARGGGENSNGTSFTKGVVQSAVANKDGSMVVTFSPDRFQYTVQKCTETSKVDRVLPDGKVQYRQECHDAGTAWGDHAPGPMTVPAGCTAGLAQGRLVYPDMGMPYQVFADRTAKRLVAVHCLALD
jgi:hypothetical protein